MTDAVSSSQAMMPGRSRHVPPQLGVHGVTGVRAGGAPDEVGGGEQDAVRRHGETRTGRGSRGSGAARPFRQGSPPWRGPRRASHVRAMTVTAARSVSDIAPETGSTTWWRMAPSWNQRRVRVLDVATPPALTVIVRRSAFGSSGCSTVTVHPAGRRCRAGAGEVAPDVDERAGDPRGQQLGHDEIGGQSLADAAWVQGEARRRRHGSSFGVDGDRGETASVVSRPRWQDGDRRRLVDAGSVAAGHQDRQHGGVVAALRRLPCLGHGGDQGQRQRVDDHRTPVGEVDPCDVTVGQEAAPTLLDAVRASAAPRREPRRARRLR